MNHYSLPLEMAHMTFRQSVRLISSQCLDPDFLKPFLPTNSSRAYFYWIPVLHIPQCPLRPTIFTIGTVTQPVASWLESVLSPSLGVFSCSLLKNGIVFTDGLRNFGQENSISSIRTLSFDVTAIFSNIPLQDVLIYLVDRYEADSLHLPIPLNSACITMFLYLLVDIID